MKKTPFVLALALISLILTGCFQSETTIHLNKDGSGTLVEETRLGAQMLAMLDQMSAMGGGGKAKEDSVSKVFSEDKAKARAGELGEGVTFEKLEPVSIGDSKGARVTYHFKDINRLKLATGDAMKNMIAEGSMTAAGKKNPPIVFSCADGQITIKLPQPEKLDTADLPAAENAERPNMDSPEVQAMVKEMFADMKLSLKVVLDSGISETNATYKNGDTITLMDVNMGKLVENADVMKKLIKVDPKDPSAAMDALKGIEGVKIEPQKNVTVTLK